MENIPLTRASLESLSTAELAKAADEYGVEISEDPDDFEDSHRALIIDEILENSGLDGEEEEELRDATIQEMMMRAAASEEGNAVAEEKVVVPVDRDIPEAVPLPKQYNITYIEVLIRDPLWVFIFWEIKGADKDICERAPDFTGYNLKIMHHKDGQKKEEVFSVSVNTSDKARFLGFSSEIFVHDGTCVFTVELHASRGSVDSVLAVTKPFCIPCLQNADEKTERCDTTRLKNPLLLLSGIKDFMIVRSGDKTLRRGTALQA